MNFLFLVFVLACAIMPGLWMLLFPEKAFTTATKPRWPGAVLLGIGVVVLYSIRHLLGWLLNPPP